MRLFVAVVPPAAIRERLAQARDALRLSAPGADVRWVATDAMHLTLKFLGEVTDARRGEVEAALVNAIRSHHALMLAGVGVGAFPTARAPRVLWAGLRGDGRALATLAADVDRALEALGFAPEIRAFHPHVTLGRVRARRGLGPLAAALAAAAETPFGEWTAGEIVLVRSHLRSTGSVYETLARVPLCGADA